MGGFNTRCRWVKAGRVETGGDRCSDGETYCDSMAPPSLAKGYFVATMRFGQRYDLTHTRSLSLYTGHRGDAFTKIRIPT